MKRERIDLTDSSLDVLIKMSEGNPGAIEALTELFKEGPLGFMSILSLDDMNMRGSQIYVAWNDYCERDLEKFKQVIKDRDAQMIATVNAECPEALAVKCGASFHEEPEPQS